MDTLNPTDIARVANMRRIKAADTAHRDRVRSARKHGYRGPLTRSEAARQTLPPVVARKGTVR
jgi:hypothetical protein